MPTAKALLLRAAAPLARAVRLQAGIVLCLHAVRDDALDGFLAPRDRIGIRPVLLDRLVTHLLSRGYDFVSLAEALTRTATPGGRPFVALTFDDGYVDMAETVLPMLATRDIPFAVFVTPGFVDGTAAMWWEGLSALLAARDSVHLPEGVLSCATPAEKRAAYARIAGLLLAAGPTARAALLDTILTDNTASEARARMAAAPMAWADIRVLEASGLVTIGGHTMTHPVLLRLGPEEARREVEGTRDRLSAELGPAPRPFAYPFGGPEQVGSRDRDLVREAGFTAGYTTENALLRPDALRDPYRLPRLPYDARFEDPALMEAYATGLPAVLRAGARSLRGWAAPDAETASRR